jgi:hypothetical protein
VANNREFVVGGRGLQSGEAGGRGDAWVAGAGFLSQINQAYLFHQLSRPRKARPPGARRSGPGVSAAAVCMMEDDGGS